MSGWRKCDTCRKVRPGEDFDDASPTCRPCLTTPVPVARTPRATTVTRRQTAPRPAATPAAAEAGPRRPLLGTVGSGDLEVRERRARRAAQEALVDSHQEEFAVLLRDARQAEGLRPSAVVPPAPPPTDEH